MITILRVLHENFLADICDNEDEDSASNDEVIKEIQSWFEPFLKPVKKNTSQFKVKAGTSKTSENKTKSYLDEVKSSRLNMEDMAEALLHPPDIDDADVREELLDIRKMIVAKELFSKDPDKIIDESAATAKSAKNKATCHYLLEFTKAYETDFYAEYPITVSQYDKISSSDISPNFCYMAIGFESYKICTWRLGGYSIELEPIGTLIGHEGIVSALSIDSSLQCLISGSHDHTVRIWDIERSICTKILSDHFAPVNDVCVSPNSMYFVSASEDKRICLFWFDDIYPKQVFTRHSEKATNCLQIHPNSMYFACACADGNLFLFQVNLTCPVRMYNKHKCDVYALSFSPLPKHLVSADIEGVIIIWDILTYSPIKILETGHEIRSISYDISGSFLVATSQFKPFTVYNIEGENKDLVAKSRNVPFPKSIYFSNDNRMFIIQSVEADEM